MTDLEVFNCNTNRSPAHSGDGNADHEQVWVHEFGDGLDRSTVLLWQGKKYSRQEYEAKCGRQERKPDSEPTPTRPSDAQQLAALVEGLRGLRDDFAPLRETPLSQAAAGIDALLLAHGFAPGAQAVQEGPQEAAGEVPGPEAGKGA